MKGRLTICPKILSYCMHNLLPRLRSLATLDIIPTEDVEDTITSNTWYNSPRMVLQCTSIFQICEKLAVHRDFLKSRQLDH